MKNSSQKTFKVGEIVSSDYLSSSIGLPSRYIANLGELTQFKGKKASAEDIDFALSLPVENCQIIADTINELGDYVFSDDFNIVIRKIRIRVESDEQIDI